LILTPTTKLVTDDMPKNDHEPTSLPNSRSHGIPAGGHAPHREQHPYRLLTSTLRDMLAIPRSTDLGPDFTTRPRTRAPRSRRGMRRPRPA
jgi:hypothetical protein